MRVVVAAAKFLLAGSLHAAIAFDVVEFKDRRVVNQAVDVGNLHPGGEKHVALIEKGLVGCVIADGLALVALGGAVNLNPLTHSASSSLRAARPEIRWRGGSPNVARKDTNLRGRQGANGSRRSCPRRSKSEQAMQT